MSTPAKTLRLLSEIRRQWPYPPPNTQSKELRDRLDEHVAKLTAEAKHASIAASQGCRVEGCPTCGAARPSSLEFTAPDRTEES